MNRTLAARIRNRLALLDGSQNVPLRLTHSVASFTFDDFPESAYSIGGKLLESVGCRATYFTAGSLMNQFADGTAHYTPEQLRELHAKGHEVGCHSFHHCALGEAGPGFAHASCEENARALRAILGNDLMMTSFAYPFGDVSPRVKWAMARRFSLCRGVHQGIQQGKADLAQLRVVSLEARHWREGAVQTLIQAAKTTPSWLIFLTHDIADSPTPFGSTPAMLQSTVAGLREAAIPILTLKAAAGLGVFGGGA